MGNNDILVEDDISNLYTKGKRQLLVNYVVEHNDSWIQYRDDNYRQKWEEYWRLWRAIWSEEDKTRDSERSKLINPALMQAIESTVAEIEEATFGKGKYWIDLEDDVADEDKTELLSYRDKFLEDLEEAGVPAELSKIFLYGAIFGTGIGKILVEKKIELKPMAREVQGVIGASRSFAAQAQEIVISRVEAIHPLNFAIDPAARTIEEAKGCTHTVLKPTHTIKAKQADGIYLEGDLGTFNKDEKIFINEEDSRQTYDNYTKIVEYHGLVPRALLDDAEDDEIMDLMAALTPEDEMDEFMDAALDYDDSDMVEAIVTISNDCCLLRANENPNAMKDRGFVAYQHDIVPNSFWGRGVAEKGYSPQKALDADLRSRIDSLALTVHPMMAGDANKIPRGQKLTVQPGRMLLTNGNPAEVFMPFKFGNLDQNSFLQTADLERQIQVGTGAIDTAAPTGINARNQTASGMSMMTASMLKRQKRVKANIDRQLLKPMIEKLMWRNMQYRPDRYPAADYKFTVVTSMGLMAREYEQAQLTQLLSVVPQDSPMFAIILGGIFNNSSMDRKQDMLQALEQWMQPDPQQQQIQQIIQQLQLENLQLENQKLKSETIENYAQAGAKEAKVQVDAAKLQIDAKNARTNEITAISNMINQGANNGKSKE